MKAYYYHFLNLFYSFYLPKKKNCENEMKEIENENEKTKKKLFFKSLGSVWIFFL